jgi:hypothetical protein
MNPPPTIDPLSQMLGAIDAKLEMVLKTQSEDREASARYRTDMRRDLGEVRDNVVDLKNRVNNTADEVAELRPIVTDHQLKFVQGTGIWNAAKAIWVILIGLGATGIGVIVHAFWPGK